MLRALTLRRESSRGGGLPGYPSAVRGLCPVGGVLMQESAVQDLDEVGHRCHIDYIPSRRDPSGAHSRMSR
jgi:hypothetical protein